ncbi:MAG: hypothetical protein IKY90_08890 [Oscillospiraceae bacterium]|nr:hypothetical protein [Oscillospiraceae bacterium]
MALKNRSSPATICWNCKNALGKCSWSKSFTPVKGWNAVRTEINQNGVGSVGVESYLVKDCPLFKEG